MGFSGSPIRIPEAGVWSRDLQRACAAAADLVDDLGDQLRLVAWAEATGRTAEITERMRRPAALLRRAGIPLPLPDLEALRRARLMTRPPRLPANGSQ